MLGSRSRGRSTLGFLAGAMVFMIGCGGGTSIDSPENVDLTGTIGLFASQVNAPRVLSCSGDLADLRISFCDFLRLTIEQRDSTFTGKTDQEYCGRTVEIVGEFSGVTMEGALISTDDSHTSVIEFSGLAFTHDVAQQGGFVTFYQLQIALQSLTVEGLNGSCWLAGLYEQAA